MHILLLIWFFSVTIDAAPRRTADCKPKNELVGSSIPTIMNELGIQKPYGRLSKGELYMILAKLDEKHVQLGDKYSRIRSPVLVRCEIDWFEDNYAGNFQLDTLQQQTFNGMKKNPAAQRVYLRECRWVYMLTTQAGGPEVKALLGRMKKNNVDIKVFANAVGQLFEVISNTVIHSLKGEQLPTPVHIMFKNPFDLCADILIDVANEIPKSKCFKKVVSMKNTTATSPSV